MKKTRTGEEAPLRGAQTSTCRDLKHQVRRKKQRPEGSVIRDTATVGQRRGNLEFRLRVRDQDLDRRGRRGSRGAVLDPGGQGEMTQQGHGEGAGRVPDTQGEEAGPRRGVCTKGTRHRV